MFESPPSGLPAATQALLVGVCQLEDTLLHVLDTESLFGIEQ
jgi:chemotaxis signal transduction protein